MTYVFFIPGSPLSVDMATLGPAVGLAHTYPTPVVTHTLNAEMVEGKTEQSANSVHMEDEKAP